MEPKTQTASFKLPSAIATISDLSQVIRESERIDDFLRQSSVRQPGTAMTLPKVSKVFDELVADNNLNLLQAEHRDYLQKTLRWLREHAPQVHVSFSTEPSPQFTHKLTKWFRTNVSPITILRVGLQPTIGVGCMVRSTNKMFDLSLKQRFAQQKAVLVAELAGQAAVAETPAVAEVSA